MITKFLLWLTLKSRMHDLNRKCNKEGICAVCPYTQTKNVTTCVICHKRAQISGYLLTLGDYFE